MRKRQDILALPLILFSNYVRDMRKRYDILSLPLILYHSKLYKLSISSYTIFNSIDFGSISLDFPKPTRRILATHTLMNCLIKIDRLHLIFFLLYFFICIYFSSSLVNRPSIFFLLTQKTRFQIKIVVSCFLEKFKENSNN